MRISWIFYIIILLLLTSAVTVVFLSPYIGIVSIVLAIILVIVFYLSVMKPIRSITNGADLLLAQDFSSRLAHVGQPETDKIIDMFNSMMESLREERLTLREQNHFLDLLIEVSPMGIVILDDRGQISNANPAAAAYLGFNESSELYGRTLASTDSPLGLFTASLPQGSTDTIRLNDSMIYRCSRLQFMDKGYEHPFILIEKLTEEVMEAEKRSYGKVIRTIAHEVNNSMGSVESLLSTAEQIIADQKQFDDIAEMMRMCSTRCHSLSEFITSFANVVRIPEANPLSVNLNEELNKWRTIIESICSTGDVVLTYKLCNEDIPVMIDTVLFEQVMINIIKNAVESIADQPGEIEIRTSATPPTLCITDNGKGIDPETNDKLFSPFFSTKANGQGIGLMLVSDILHKHGFRFKLATDSDGLTRFTINFNGH